MSWCRNEFASKPHVTHFIWLQNFEYTRRRAVAKESLAAAILISIFVHGNVCFRVAGCIGSSRVCRLHHRDQSVDVVRVSCVVFCCRFSFLFSAVDHGRVATTS